MKKSSKLSIIGIAAMLLFSCSKEGSPIPVIRDDFKTIPVEEARNLVLEYAKKLYPETRSAIDITNSEVLPLTKDLLTVSTRAESLSEIPDTSFYIFNFPDESGYAVASANTKYGRSLLCLTEKGSLTSEDFSPIRTKATADSSGLEGGTGFIADLICASIMANEIAPPIDSTEIGGGGGGQIKYGPYVTTKWTQGYYPFNQYTPNHVAPGCTAIATAQVMAYNEYSNSMSFDGHLCNWSTMKTVKPYDNINSLGTTEAQEQVGRFVYELGKTNNIRVRYDNGSWAQADGIRRALENYGYQSVNKNTGFSSNNIALVDSKIKAGYPVIVSGNHGLEGDDIIGSFYGHAWVVDGLFLTYYHINWGWGGDSDGYFSKGVFKTANRHSTDSIIDANVPTASQDEEYLWWFRIITYSL